MPSTRRPADLERLPRAPDLQQQLESSEFFTVNVLICSPVVMSSENVCVHAFVVVVIVFFIFFFHDGESALRAAPCSPAGPGPAAPSPVDRRSWQT